MVPIDAPATAAGLGRWPATYSEDFVRRSWSHGVLRLLGRSTFFCSDYSGVDMQRDGMWAFFSEMLSEHERKHGAIAQRPTLQWTRSADSGSLQRRVLVNRSVTDGELHCVFGCNLGRAPVDVQQAIEELAPTKKRFKAGLSVEEAITANQNVCQILQDHSKRIFAPSLEDYCYVHGEQCFVYPKYALKLSATVGGSRKRKWWQSIEPQPGHSWWR